MMRVGRIRGFTMGPRCPVISAIAFAAATSSTMRSGPATVVRVGSTRVVNSVLSIPDDEDFLGDRPPFFFLLHETDGGEIV